MVGAGVDAKSRHAGGAEELSVNDQGTYGQAVAVVPKVVELDVVGRCDNGVRVVEQLRVAGVAVVETALGLAHADIGELGVSVHGLVAAGAEQGFGLVAELVLEQQAQPDGSAVPQGNQTSRRAGGGVEIEGAGERRSFRTVRDFAVVVAGIGLYSDADLPEVR